MSAPCNENAPNHVAIIMDGNGRWAKTRGLPRIEGHRRGVETVREMLAECRELNIRYLTLYAFSAENWRRPADEVDALMGLLVYFLRRELNELVRNGVRLHVIGEIDELPAAVREELSKTMAATASFTEWHLTLALSYGSRQEAASAARAFAAAVLRGEERPEDCTWERLARHLHTRDLPDPDLIIRTSGESRLSNFLMLQGAYSELYFSPVPWPDFSREHLREAVECFKRRERRYGLTGEQLRALVG